MSGLDSCRNGTKDEWRGWLWREIVHHLPEFKNKPRDFSVNNQSRRDCRDKRVLYLCGPDGAEARRRANDRFWEEFNKRLAAPNPADALCERERLYYNHHAALNCGGIAIGTGPSFHDWIKRPLTPGTRYGCGIASQYIDLDVYCINSGVHKQNVPQNTIVFAKDRAVGNLKNAFIWPESWPIASQCGGMCVHLAAMNHARVGLVGFCKPVDPTIDSAFRSILEYWKARGRVFVSLMKESAFQDLCEPGWIE